MFEFTCPRCGNPGSVPFQPSNPDRVLCSDCHEETGGKTFDLSRAQKAPRRRHNTRVVVNIVCSECGKQSELDYAPKGVPLDKIKCAACLEAEFGSESRWGMIRELKEREQKLRPKPVFNVECAACHKETDLPFKPDPERTYYCKSCYANDGVPVGPNYRPGEKKEVRQNLFVRRRGRRQDSDDKSLAAPQRGRRKVRAGFEEE